jgi:hypothetical protein
MIIPDTYHKIYEYIDFDQYYTFHLLNKKCYDIIHNHNIIFEYHRGEISYEQFKLYDCEVFSEVFNENHNLKFVHGIADKTFKKLLVEYMNKIPDDKEEAYVYFDRDPNKFKTVVITAKTPLKAIYKTIKYEIDHNKKGFAFLSMLLPHTTQHNHDQRCTLCTLCESFNETEIPSEMVGRYDYPTSYIHRYVERDIHDHEVHYFPEIYDGVALFKPISI